MTKTMEPMRSIRVFSVVSAALLLTACSTLPKVTADVVEQHPARSVDSVRVYEPGEALPAEARAIGTVRVRDGGLTPTYRCLYANMLALAVRKTAENGGNAFHVDEHKLPQVFGSTCHQVKGTMYVVADSLVTENTSTGLARIEERADAELVEQVRRQVMTAREKMADTPHNFFKASAGPSWITTRFVTPWHEYKGKVGFEYALQYQHVFRILGFGIDLLNYSTSFPEGFDVKLLYVGPSMVVKYRIGGKWLLDAAFGLGYSRYKESAGRFSATEGALGVMGELGVEYMLSKHVGLGIQTNILSMRMKEPEGVDLGDDTYYGLGRMNLLGGLRVYF